jgi:hypothetical protein
VFRRPIVVAAAPVPAVPAPLRYVRRLARFGLRWSVRLLLAGVAAVLLLLAAALVWSVPGPSAGARSQGVNAVWVAHTWVADPHTDDEHAQMAARWRSAGISDVLVHVGPLDGDGSAPTDRTPRAAAFAAAMHEGVPGVRVQAYLGQVLATNGSGPLRLHDRAVRERIVAAARGYLDLGFDGIHYDLEPIRAGDRDLLDLLDRTRELTQGRGAVLSVAMEQLQIHPAVSAVLLPVMPTYAEPDESYLSAIADRVDQIAIMTYDSSMPTRSSFVAYTAWQTARTAELVSDRVTLFMGVPTYDEGMEDHYPWPGTAETVDAGLRGIRRGLDSLGDRRAALKPVGAAVYADWTTSPDEWRTFISEWVSPEN